MEVLKMDIEKTLKMKNISINNLIIPIFLQLSRLTCLEHLFVLLLYHCHLLKSRII